MTSHAHDLAARLRALGYRRLFGDPPERTAIDDVGTRPELAGPLQELIDDRSESWQARFLASEFLFRYVDMLRHRQCDHGSLQEAYLEALRHNYSGNGADWAFGVDAATLGPLGHTAVSLGTDILARGLDDPTPVPMQFPWTPPDDIHPPYRVKDVVALIVARGRDLAIDLSGPPQARDAAIATLRDSLA